MSRKFRNVVTVVLAILLLGTIGFVGAKTWAGGVDKNKTKSKMMTKEERTKIHEVRVYDRFNVKSHLEDPINKIINPMLQAAELKNNITIDKRSMLKSERCFYDLLTSYANISKISTGKDITGAKVEIISDTRDYSMWTKWQRRKLDEPELKVRIFYDNNKSETTHIFCNGQKYGS